MMNEDEDGTVSADPPFFGPPMESTTAENQLFLVPQASDRHDNQQEHHANDDDDDDSSTSSGASSNFILAAFSDGDPSTSSCNAEETIENQLWISDLDVTIQRTRSDDAVDETEVTSSGAKLEGRGGRRSHNKKSQKSGQHHPSHTFRRVQRVGRHAALTTKQQLWDSNAASIDAALSAVNQWEAGYLALRGLLVGGASNVGGLYHAAKDQASKLEHGLLQPIRDWIILPALVGMERVVCETVGLVQQHHRGVYEQSQALARSVPVVGESVLAPSIFWSVELAKRTWDIAQYPIPSKQQVVNTVDSALTGTKWALSVAGRESLLYIKRADAILTRTLSTAQWKVLGSGPYATLDKPSKAEVIDHLCERYFSLSQDSLARYELAAHIRRHNLPLYQDLVLTGVLQDRGKLVTQDDEWLSTCPIYRSLEVPFLLETDVSNVSSARGSKIVSPLWFRLPNVNGKKPGSDAQWIPFRRSENRSLEERYLQIVNHGVSKDQVNESVERSDGTREKEGQPEQNQDTLKTPTKRGGSASLVDNGATVTQQSIVSRLIHPTIAKWYDPDLSKDVLVDQQRAAVSFHQGCSKCREPLNFDQPLAPPRTLMSAALCKSCALVLSSSLPTAISTFASLNPPPVATVVRPTCWRFHGPGDTVRRATWFLDTARYGLQPFDDEASGILEDAYLFLKWMSLRQAFQTDEDNAQEGTEAAILTVEVPCPDGADRLVQFTSLTRATAIQKGLGSAIALFKRRVYRGAWLFDKTEEQRQREEFASLEDTLVQAVESHGVLGDTLVPDMSIRSALTPVSKNPASVLLTSEHRLVLYGKHHSDVSLAVLPEQLDEAMGKYLDDGKDGKVDHLVLVVHGIGEMLRTIDLFGLSIPNLSSIVDCCSYLRKNHSEVQDAHFAHMYPGAAASSLASAGHVEYLPIEWHEAFSILSQRREHPANDAHPSRRSISNLPPVRARDRDHRSQAFSTSTPGHHVMMKDISLKTIPNMREFANDTLLDVLYFMSPEHHDVIIDIVTSEMNSVVERFRKLTEFSGRVSLVGHSLGSIISWDILAHQLRVDESRPGLPDVPSHGSLASTISGYFSPTTEMSYLYGYAPEVTSPTVDGGTNPYAPTIPALHQSAPLYQYPQLEFEVDNFFLLGSPVAVFLMIRNQRKPLSEDFSLPGCHRVFNIFHPYDPGKSPPPQLVCAISRVSSYLRLTSFRFP